MITRERAYELRAMIEKAAGAGLDDKDGSAAVELYPVLKGDGSLVSAGTRVNWGGRLKRAAVDLWDTAENTPAAAPALWEDIQYREGIRIIPETITAGLAFAKDELGYWGEEIYKSLVDNNVWTPDAYPAGWELVE